MVSSLPFDVLPIILSHLSIFDILQLRLVCKDYFYATKNYAIWLNIIQKHFICRNLPLPGLHGRSLEKLTADDLERLVMKAEKYKSNWSSGMPRITRSIEFPTTPNSRIVSLEFFFQRGEHWLFSLSAAQTSGPHTSIFQCWDLKTNPPTCIASRTFHDFCGLAYNTLLTGEAAVAVMTPEYVGSSHSFTALTSQDASLRICLIDINPGTRASTSDDVGGGEIHPHMSRRNPAQACIDIAVLEEKASGGMMLIGDLILAQDDMGRTFLYHFRTPQTRVELLGPRRNTVQQEKILGALTDQYWIITARITTVEIYVLPSVMDHSIQVEPIGVHRWQWRVDLISLSRITGIRDQVAPIRLAVRFGTDPWPSNYIHCFAFDTNDAFDSSQPASKHNLPYILPLENFQVIGSPLRLGAMYPMAIGSHGTIIYTDSHTENYTSQGQRLAGNRMNMTIEDETSGALTREYSVYHSTERDEWTTIALQEEEGMIAIGHVDGRIMVLDYA